MLPWDPQTNSSPLKNGGWETTFLLEKGINMIIYGTGLGHGKTEQPPLRITSAAGRLS